MTRHCPRCQLPMDIVRDAGIVVDWCKTCNGLWFDMGELNQYMTDRKSPEKFIKDCKCTKGELPCPVCWESMDEVRAGNFVIDRCTQCRGLWFDAGEVGMLKEVMTTTTGQPPQSICKGMLGHMLDSDDPYMDDCVKTEVVIEGAELAAEAADEVGATEVLANLLGGLFDLAP